MPKDYEDYDSNDSNDSNEEHEEDDDIGALGSILSWDEDEDGGVHSNVGTNPALSDRESMNSSALPDLVSFNMKDGSLNTLQQLQGSGNDGGNITIPMPTPIDFGQSQLMSLMGNQSTLSQSKQQQQDRTRIESDAAKQQNIQVAQAQQLQQQQLQQLQQQQQQLQQQMQLQQQQLLGSVGQQAQAQHHPGIQSASQVTQQQAQVSQQVAQQAFALFQQGSLLAQSRNTKQPQQQLAIGPGIPTLMMPNVQQNHEQRADSQTNPQFAFAADPNAFLRQLQVAQLQQQFNAVQQGRPVTQQVIGAASQAQVPSQVPAAIQQQLQFQPQVPLVAPVPPAQQQQPTQLPQPAPKKRRAQSQKKPPAAKDAPQQSSKAATASARAPVVSASDTDGEFSLMIGKMSSKMATTSSNASVDIDTSNMTPEEKARANRDRNREHARNTRLRKKAYLEKLKSTVDELCRERDTLVSERAGAANILVEMHNTRTEVLMSFFALRSANEKRRELWASILDESCFACVMPVTPYRSFPASEVQVSKCQRTILGIDGMMSDTASLHVLLNSLVDRSRFPNATIVFRYTLVTEEAVVAGNQMMARWVMSTLNATQCGARMEVAKQGMLCCKFNSAHKIIGLELMFDVMALMLQLKQAAGSDTFSVIPNTVQTCQRSFDIPMVMTLAEEPYTIVQVNKLWEEMTGYKAEEVVGKASCRILEGEETDSGAVEGLMNEIRFKRPASAMIVHYKRSGERFRNFFLSYPLSTDSRITHYLSLSNNVVSMGGGSMAEVAVAQQGKQGVLEGPVQGNLQIPNHQIPPTTSQTQAAFYNGMQNLQGAVSAGQPNRQPLFGLPPVLSSALATSSSQGAMLPPSLTALSSAQKYSLGALKRGLDDEEKAGEPRKRAKTVGGSEPAP